MSLVLTKRLFLIIIYQIIIIYYYLQIYYIYIHILCMSKYHVRYHNALTQYIILLKY